MRVTLLAALILSSACARREAPAVKVIVGARLGSIEHSVVVIEDGKVRAAGPQSSTPVPKGAEITGGLGGVIEPATLAPGEPADLVLRGAQAPGGERRMRGGEWVN